MSGFDHFGLIAPWYDRYAHLEKPLDLIRWVEMPSSGRLLDAGGGTGRVAQACIGDETKIFVADISPVMVRLAASKNKIQAVCATAEELPYPTGYFDRIIMVDAFHHVVSQKDTAYELYRVLKTGGRMVIEEPDIDSIWVKLIALGEKILLMRSHFLRAERIASLFSELSAEVRIENKNNTAWIIIQKR
jgi:ubiquinone/menaquinone biosynthesis C-methylase UbiE